MVFKRSRSTTPSRNRRRLNCFIRDDRHDDTIESNSYSNKYDSCHVNKQEQAGKHCQRGRVNSRQSYNNQTTPPHEIEIQKDMRNESAREQNDNCEKDVQEYLEKLRMATIGGLEETKYAGEYGKVCKSIDNHNVQQIRVNESQTNGFNLSFDVSLEEKLASPNSSEEDGSLSSLFSTPAPPLLFTMTSGEYSDTLSYDDDDYYTDDQQVGHGFGVMGRMFLLTKLIYDCAESTPPCFFDDDNYYCDKNDHIDQERFIFSGNDDDSFQYIQR